MGVRVRAALRLICAISILSGLAAAQTYYRYDGRVAPAGYASGPANVAICKTAAATTPCPSPALAYSDQNGVNLLPSSFPADINGNYHFYALAGTYVIQTYGTGYTTTNTTVTLGPQSPGAVVPSTASPVFNVKTYGAVGDARSVIDAVTSNGSTTVTSATASWSAADVGKIIWCNNASTGIASVGQTTIASVQSASSITVAAAGNSSSGSAQVCVWATQDDTAAFLAAYTAAAKGISSNSVTHVGGPNLIAPSTVYIPAGGYVVSGNIYNFNSTVNLATAPNLLGEGRAQSTLYLSPNFSLATAPLINLNNGDAFKIGDFLVEGALGLFTGSSARSGLLQMTNVNNCTIPNLEMDDIGFTTANSTMVYANFARNCSFYNPYIQQPGGTAPLEYGVYLSASDGNIIVNPVFSNHFINLLFTGDFNRDTIHMPNEVIGGFVDECNVGTGDACTEVNNSTVDFFGTTLMGGHNSYPLRVLGNGTAYIAGSNVGDFTSAANNSAIYIDSGSTAYATMSTLRGNGTSPSVNNSGTYIDVGGNNYQNCTNTSCSAATIAQSLTGTQPVAALTHSATNPFIPTDTAQTWMQMTPDQPIRVTRIQVTPSNGASVNCSVAPVFQITNGTTTQTVNIANATATDDSGVISSGNTYVSGTAMTFGISAAGTCTTAPTNMNVNVLWQAVAPSQ